MWVVLLLLLSIVVEQRLNAQVSKSNISLLGNHGLILTPSARHGNDKELNLNIGYFPEQYRILTQKPLPFNEWHTNVTIMFLPFLEVTATLMTPDNLNEQGWGIGDRSYKAKLHFLQETKFLPSLAVGIHDPFSTNTNQGAVYIVGTKNIVISTHINADVNFGHGFDIQKELWVKTGLFQDNPEDNLSQLKGFFGGIQVKYGNNYSLLFDYDTEKLNVGFSAMFLKYFTSHIYFLGLDGFSFGISGRFLFGNRVINTKDL